MGPAEALLCPPDAREAAGVLEEHPRRVSDGQRIVSGDLQEKVAVREFGPQLIHPESGRGAIQRAPLLRLVRRALDRTRR